MLAPVAVLGPIGKDAVMDLRAFAARLKELREAAGLSQKELAEKSGLSQKGISNWEQGIREPGWLAVLKLAEALGVNCLAFQEEPESVPEPRRGRPPKPEPESTERKKEPKGKGKQP